MKRVSKHHDKIMCLTLYNEWAAYSKCVGFCNFASGFCYSQSAAEKAMQEKAVRAFAAAVFALWFE